MSQTTGRPGIEQAWRHVYDRAYRLDRTPPISHLDTSGWVNTYTGQPYGPAEMEEWTDKTVGRILEHRPRRVLEIGCGTGLLGSRLIPVTEAYCGLDFSVGALQRFSLGIDPATRSAVCLLLGSAKDLSLVPRWDYDCIVLNSVVQYFPDTAYVHEVLRQAAGLLRPPGILFLGDVRHRDLLAVHHVWRLWRAASDGTTVGEALAEAERHHRTDREWSTVPADLAGLLRSVGAQHVESRLKDGLYPTEMNLFRYDAIGYFQPPPHPIADPADWLVWEPGIEQRIDWRSGLPAGILGIPYTRLDPPNEARRILRDASENTTVASLRMAREPRPDDDPLAAVHRMAADHGAVIRTNWARDRSGHTLDLAVMSEGDTSGPGPLLVRWPTTGHGNLG